MPDIQILTLWSQSPRKFKVGRRWDNPRGHAALPPVPHGGVLLQGGTQGRDLLCQALQDRVLHLSLVGTVEALERVSGVQGVHLRRRQRCPHV